MTGKRPLNKSRFWVPWRPILDVASGPYTYSGSSASARGIERILRINRDAGRF